MYCIIPVNLYRSVLDGIFKYVFSQIAKWKFNHLYNISTYKLRFGVKYKFQKPIFVPSMYRLQNNIIE